MTNEDALKKQVEDLQRLRVKDARRGATMFGSISIVMLIALVYAYVKNIEAERRADEARVTQELCEAKILEVQASMKQLEQLTIELELCKASKKE